jgi:hypothetical protein
VRHQLRGAPLPANLKLPFTAEIERACEVAPTFSPLVAMAIKWCETGSSTDPARLQGGADPTTLLMPDGSNAGRGIFQLTSSFPANWRDPYENALYAVEHFLLPAESFWANQYGLQGEALVRAIGAEYNAGRLGAQQGHDLADIGLFTTFLDGLSYADRCLLHYQNLEKGAMP